MPPTKEPRRGARIAIPPPPMRMEQALPPTPLSPQPARVTRYLFSELPMGKALNAEGMTAIGFGGGEGTGTLTSGRFPAPDHLRCESCRQRRRECWIAPLRVAAPGGLFHLAACYPCWAKCPSSTRRNEQYLAFVDGNTAVFVDKVTLRVVRTARATSEAEGAGPSRCHSSRDSSAMPTIPSPVTPIEQPENRQPGSSAQLSNTPVEPAWRQADGQIFFNQANLDRKHEAQRAEWHAERAQYLANAITWAAERARLKISITELEKERDQHVKDKLAWEGEREQYTSNAAAWNEERQRLDDERHDEHQGYASNEAAWSAERRQFAEGKAAWDAERRKHTTEKASWEAERQEHAGQKLKWAFERLQHGTQRATDQAALDDERKSHASTSATLRAELKLHAPTAAELDDKRKQLAAISATLDDERAQHAVEEAAWSAERVQHGICQTAWMRERQTYAEDRRAWVAERGQHGGKEAAWKAEREGMVAKWHAANQKERANFDKWRAEREGYRRRIAELERLGAVDKKNIVDLLDCADRALVGIRSAVGPAANKHPL